MRWIAAPGLLVDCRNIAIALIDRDRSFSLPKGLFISNVELRKS